MDDDSNLIWAVFLEQDDGTYMPVSYGYEEYECSLWLDDHKCYFNGRNAYVGLVLNTVIHS